MRREVRARTVTWAILEPTGVNLEQAAEPLVAPVSTTGARRDWLLWAGVCVWFLSVLPSLIDVLPPDPAFYWADQYNDVPTLVLVLVAAGLRVRDAEDRKEHTFWRLVIAGMLGWIAVRVLYVFVPYEARGLKTDLFSDLCYLAGYLCLALGLELRPDRDPPEVTRVRRVESLAALVFGFLLLTYFTLMPSVFDPAVYASWVSSMLLYAVLDTFLLVRAVSLLRSRLAPGWVVPMRWFAAVFALWLIGDLVEGSMYMEAIPFIEPGTPADLLWITPTLLLFIAARRRAWAAPSVRPPPSVRAT